jgi:hypothetical protein
MSQPSESGPPVDRTRSWLVPTLRVSDVNMADQADRADPVAYRLIHGDLDRAADALGA